MKKLIYLFVMVMLVGGCATLGYNAYTPSEPSSAEINLTKYNDAFFSIYDSNLRSWIGKSIEEVKSAFIVEPGQYGCCSPDIHSLDIDGNGYISYESADSIDPYRSARLTFYIKRNRIYNVVKE